MVSLNKVIDNNYQAVASIEEIRSQLLNRIPSVLRYLLPNGVARNHVFYIGDVDGTKGESLKIELKGPKAGLWNDFATEEGGDIIALWARKKNFNTRSDFPKLMEDIQNWLGIYVPFQNIQNNLEKKAPANDDLGEATAKWDYTNKDGKVIATVFRYDPKGKSKQFRPYDANKKINKAPNSRPLYNLVGITASERIILVEGEKCAQALIDKGICTTTAMFGATAPLDKTDWSPLKGKDIIIWPDNDTPGKTYADRVANFLRTKPIKSVAMLDVPLDKPEKWDAADAVAEGLNIEEFIEQTTKKTVYSRKRIPFLKTKIYRSDKSPIAEDLISPRILTPTGLMVFGGAPKVGKSDFLLSWMAHMAAGVPFLDMVPARPLKICFLQTEIDYDYLRERIDTIILDESLWELVEENLSITPKVNVLLNEQGVEELIEDIKDHFQDNKVDIIVIDPLYDVFDNNGSDLGENDNTLMNFFLKNRIEYLCDQVNPKAGIIVAHHLRKTTKSAFEEAPFDALAGASCIRRRFTSGLILYCPDENQTLRKLIFEIRNGPKILPKWVDKIDGSWQELEGGSARLVNQKLGKKQDAERNRRYQDVLNVIKRKALDGKAYTMHQFCDVFENEDDLGSKKLIHSTLKTLIAKGYVKFFQNGEDYGLTSTPGSKFGYLCTENMLLKNDAGKKALVYPTHFRCSSSKILPVVDPKIWVYTDKNYDIERKIGGKTSQ